MYKENTISVFVKAIAQETRYVKRFALCTVSGEKLPPFSGGSHITTIFSGSQGIMKRNYSLIGDPDHTEEYHIAIRLANPSNGGSSHWHDQVQVGDKLHISYPKNHFPLSFKAKHHVFYAAGIGITPFLSMMKALKQKEQSFELHYASKSQNDCAFFDEIIETYPEQSHFYFSQVVVPNKMTSELLLGHQIGTHVYFCGPEMMINEFKESALRFSYPSASIHYELFTPPPLNNPKPFLVKLKNSKKTIAVSKENTLLDTLLENEIEIPYACRAGRCGTCELKVLEGEVEHHDVFLNEEQKKTNKIILSCVSRAASDIIEIMI